MLDQGFDTELHRADTWRWEGLLPDSGPTCPECLPCNVESRGEGTDGPRIDFVARPELLTIFFQHLENVVLVAEKSNFSQYDGQPDKGIFAFASQRPVPTAEVMSRLSPAVLLTKRMQAQSVTLEIVLQPLKNGHGVLASFAHIPVHQVCLSDLAASEGRYLSFFKHLHEGQEVA